MRATARERVWRWCRRKPALASSLLVILILFLIVIIGSPIAVYRINRARKAEQAQLQRAEQESLKARQLAYASDMSLAHQAVQANELDRALELLDRHRPAANQPGSSRREEALISKSAIRNPQSARAKSEIPSTISSHETL